MLDTVRTSERKIKWRCVFYEVFYDSLPSTPEIAFVILLARLLSIRKETDASWKFESLYKYTRALTQEKQQESTF